MVDALREVGRVLVPGGKVVDARPDSRVYAYAERRRTRGFQRFGIIKTNRGELASDRAADGAIAQVKADGLFVSRRRGRFWHLVAFDSLRDLREYLADHLRFVHRAQWVVDEATRRRHENDPFVIRRAVRFEVFETSPAGRRARAARP